MADVSYFHLHGDDGYEENDDVLVPFSPRSGVWPQDLDGFDVSPSDLDFPPSEFFLCRQRRLPDRNPIRILNQNSASSPLDRDNQVNFVIDMFNHRAEQSRVIVETDLDDSDRIVRVSDLNEDINSNDLEFDFESGLGLGLGFPVEVRNCNDLDDDNTGFIVTGAGEAFFLSSRQRGGGARSELEDPAYIMSGLSITDSDEDHENEIIGVDDDFGVIGDCNEEEENLRRCWDAFQLEDDDNARWESWDVPAHQHFDWEEVDGRIDEREVLNMFLNAETENHTTDDLEWEFFLNSHNLEANPPNPETNNYTSVNDLEWEVFLNVHNPDVAGEFEDYNDAETEHEMLFGQFAENVESGLVRPPASKKAVERLLSVVMTLEDLKNNNTLCAVCKDEIGVGEKAKQLPCTHHYHQDCIIPWLNIRNTCPVCRHELPTDDPDYERKKAERESTEF